MPSRDSEKLNKLVATIADRNLPLSKRETALHQAEKLAHTMGRDAERRLERVHASFNKVAREIDQKWKLMSDSFERALGPVSDKEVNRIIRQAQEENTAELLRKLNQIKVPTHTPVERTAKPSAPTFRHTPNANTGAYTPPKSSQNQDPKLPAAKGPQLHPPQSSKSSVSKSASTVERKPLTLQQRLNAARNELLEMKKLRNSGQIKASAQQADLARLRKELADIRSHAGLPPKTKIDQKSENLSDRKSPGKRF